MFSNVINGVLGRNRTLFRSILSEFEGKDIEIIIQRKKKTRSVGQNAYYWGVIIPIIREGFKNQMGERLSTSEVHEFLKTRFNYIEKVNENTGEILKLPKSTTKNTTTEQEEYHEECRRFADEWLNIGIPLPNTQTELEIN